MRHPVAAIACVLFLTLAFPCLAHAERGAPWVHGTLFRVERPGRPPSFVLGTVHSADPRVLATVRRLDPVLQQVRTVAIEADLGPGDRIAFLEAAQWPDERRLGDLFEASSVARIHALLDPRLPADVVERLKPWAVFLKLAEDPHASGETLDHAVVALARRRRLSVLGLELPEEQASAFDTIPLASQVALVRFVLTRRDELGAASEEAQAAWLAGDLARLRALAFAPAERDPSLRPHLEALVRAVIEGRSALLAHRLFGPLRSGAVLVLVGASHLPGDRGLLALLAADGYRIRRLR